MAPSPSGWMPASWSAPSSIQAGISTRQMAGVSLPPYDSANFGAHVGDDPLAVQENRRRLREALALPAEPVWLQQVHGIDVAEIDGATDGTGRVADAAVTRTPGVVLAIQTADCLPILLAAGDGGEIAAIHAGWRGLAAGVIESTLARLHTRPADVLAWIGPGIGADAFEVGDEVRLSFLAQTSANQAAVNACFRGHGPGKWLCDLAQLAAIRLRDAGLRDIVQSGVCTFRDAARFFSHRRDRVGGRMVSLIWMRGH